MPKKPRIVTKEDFGAFLEQLRTLHPSEPAGPPEVVEAPYIAWLGCTVEDLPSELKELLVQDPADPRPAERELERITDRLIAEDAAVGRAYEAVKAAHRVAMRPDVGDDDADADSRKVARDEIAGAVAGCLCERWNALPDRFYAVMGALGRGVRAIDLFPDDLYGMPKGSA